MICKALISYNKVNMCFQNVALHLYLVVVVLKEAIFSDHLSRILIFFFCIFIVQDKKESLCRIFFFFLLHSCLVSFSDLHRSQHFDFFFSFLVLNVIRQKFLFSRRH